MTKNVAQDLPDELGMAAAQLLLEAGAVQISQDPPFILAGGWASPVYVDVRRIVGEARHRRRMMDLVEAFCRRTLALETIEAVVAAETAGIPFGAWLADRLGLKLRYVRKRPLGIGRNAQVEGGPVDGLKVLLVDDMTTDGGSKLAFARGLRSAGATVDDIVCVFFHDVFPGVAARFDEAGLHLHALASWSDILKSGQGAQLTSEQRDLIAQFLSDPVGWSSRHGGRISLSRRI
jgi:orotate phosphoribosyltransferase